jgi:hypothetical protein
MNNKIQRNDPVKGCRMCGENEEYIDYIESENARYLSAIKAFCEASKYGDLHWKIQPYIAALFEIAKEQGR